MADPQWTEKAQFMREVGATYAEWSDDPEGNLVKLQLGPAPMPKPLGPAQQMAQRFAQQNGQPMPSTAADRLRQRHETMFAASSFKPPLPAAVAPTPDSVVPRAVRAKQAALKGGTSKRTKR